MVDCICKQLDNIWVDIVKEYLCDSKLFGGLNNYFQLKFWEAKMESIFICRLIKVFLENSNVYKLYSLFTEVEILE